MKKVLVLVLVLVLFFSLSINGYCNDKCYGDFDSNKFTTIYLQGGKLFKKEIEELNKCIPGNPSLKDKIDYIAVEIIRAIDAGKINTGNDGIKKINDVISIFELNAKHGNTSSQHNLAAIYNSDPKSRVFQLIGNDYKKFVYWTKIAASNGDPRSIFNLAVRMASIPDKSVEVIKSDYEMAYILHYVILLESKKYHIDYLLPFVNKGITKLEKRFDDRKKEELIKIASTFNLKTLAP